MNPLLLVGLTLHLASPADAPADELDTARSLLVEGRLEEAKQAATSHREAGGLASEELARCHLLEGMAWSLIAARDGDGEPADEALANAEMAFVKALVLDASSDPGVRQPAVRAPFERARGRAKGLGLEVRPYLLEAATPTKQARTERDEGQLREAAIAGLQLTLVRDDLGLAREATLAFSGSDLTAPLHREAPLAFFARPTEGWPAAEARLAVLDEHGNALRSQTVATPVAASEAAIAKREEQAQPLSRFDFTRYPWLTIAGGAVIGLGIFTAVAAGAMVAIYDRGSIAFLGLPPGVRLAAFSLIGFGVLLGAAGGAGVVGDQIWRFGLANPYEGGTEVRPLDEGSPRPAEDAETARGASMSLPAAFSTLGE